MSRRDAENLALEEWLQQLGCSTQLQPQEVRHMLAPNMRSVWRHLQKYVKPVRSVQTIRKNLLLAKLKKENVEPDQIRNFQVQTCEEFALAKRVSNMQQQIDSKNNQRKTVENEIKTLMHKIGEEKYNVISKEEEIKEMEDKTALLNLKLSQVQKDTKKLVADTSKASLFKTMPISNLHLEESSILSNIATILMKNKLTPLTCLCEEDKALLLSKEYSVNTLYRAFLLASDCVSKSLKSFVINLESFDEHVKKNLDSSETLSFSYHLKHLSSLVVQNQFDIDSCLEKVRWGSTLLEKEKIELAESIKEVCSNSCADINEDGYDVNLEADEFVNMFVNNILSLNKAAKLKELTEEVVSKYCEYDSLRCQIENNKVRGDELYEEVNKKVSLIDELYSKIYKYNPKVNHVKDNVVQMCNESVSDFLTKICKEKEYEDVFIASKDIISKEIKIFHDVPLCALTRRWEDSYELLSKELIEDLSLNSELRVFLLQSVPKNIMNSILEKKWWICSLMRNMETNSENMSSSIQ